MRRTLREAVGQSGLSVAEGGNTVRGVKVLGFDSQNRRRYTLESAQQGLHLYEGCPVNVDHPSDNPNATRAIRDRIGWLENCSVEPDGIRGDLLLNPKHSLTEAILWWAKNQPGKLGLSHNAVGQGETRGGVFVVEKIMSVRSVDLVTDPASTKSLFEGRRMKKKLTEADDALAGDETANLDGGAVADVPVDAGGGMEGDWKDHLLDGIKKVLADEGLDSSMQLKLAQAILRVIKSGHNGGDDTAGLGAEEEPELEAEDEPEESDEDAYEDEEEKPGGKMEGKKKKPTADTATVKSLREELDRLKAREAVRSRTEQALRLCKKAGLPKPAVTQVFLEQLANCDDDSQMARLIEDRRRTCGIQRPRSVGGGGGRTMDAKEFARSLKGGK